jgi:hypothetical protein
MSATGRSGLRTASTAGYLAAVNRGVATRAGRGVARPQEARSGAELKAAQERGELGAQGRRSDLNLVRDAGEVPTIDSLGIPRRRAKRGELARAGDNPNVRTSDNQRTTLDASGNQYSAVPEARTSLLRRCPRFGHLPNNSYGNNQIRTHGGNVRSSDISSSTLDSLGIPSPKEGARASGTFVAVRQPVQRDVRSADIAPTNGARASGTVATAAQERGELATQARHPSSVRASDTAPTTLDALGIPRRRARKSINVRSTGIGARFPQRHAVASWKHVGNRAPGAHETDEKVGEGGLKVQMKINPRPLRG